MCSEPKWRCFPFCLLCEQGSFAGCLVPGLQVARLTWWSCGLCSVSTWASPASLCVFLTEQPGRGWGHLGKTVSVQGKLGDEHFYWKEARGLGA
jgi:hypothetical protein